MLSKGKNSSFAKHTSPSSVQISLAILSILVIFIHAETVCNGTELSVENDAEVGLLTEKPCTKVYGNIVIRNLREFVKT